MTVMSRSVGGLVGIACVLALAGPAQAQPAEEALPPWLEVDPLPGDDRPAPSDDQVRGLSELEREMLTHQRLGEGYAGAVRAIAEREHERRRRDRARLWDARVATEDRLATEARERAIRLLQRFVREHDADPVHTPDALLRLGELLYERQLATFQAGDLDGEPDFAPVIAVLEELVARFPAFPRVDAALYILGYCESRIGRTDSALARFRAIVCARGDAYETCEALAAPPSVIAEVWLRIGEHHFDDVVPGSLDRAIAAYRRALALDPEGRLADLARYKLAWSLYRSDRYPEAIEQFGALIEASDRARAATGRAGSELRAEALEYVAIALAWDDWDADGQPDGVSALARATDPAIVPQDRAWSAEVLLRLGEIQFAEDRYDLAIATYDEAIARFPMDHRVPSAIVRIARAHERMGDAAASAARRGTLLAYGEGSTWAEHNREEHPREVAEAARLAEAAILHEAIRRHQEAQRLRERGTPDESGRVAAADAEYAQAARLYAQHLALYPNSTDAYEIEHWLAEALYWGGRYEEAAARYESVRDSRYDDRYLGMAARRAVESRHRTLEALGITLRTEAPPANERPEVPEALQRLAHAREVYLARVDARHDVEHVRDAYDFNNALVLELYGYPSHARRRYQAIWDRGCGELANAAWTQLVNMSIRDNDRAEIERLTALAGGRACADDARELDCRGADAMHPRCRVPDIEQTFAFRDALTAYEAARTAAAASQARLYEAAARAMLRAVDRHPAHGDVPRALAYAADALEHAALNDAASRVYERIIDEVGPRRDPDPEAQRELDRVVASAFYRRGQAAARALDGERAVESYAALFDSDRFASSDDPEIAALREDALIQAARLLAVRGDHARAGALFRRIAEMSQDAGNVRAARFQVAEMARARRDWNVAAREYRAFADAYGADREAAGDVGLALSRLAEVRGEQGRAADRERALRETIEAFRAAGVPPGTDGAEEAAAARFALAEIAERDLGALDLDPGSQPSVPAWSRAFLTRVQDAARRTSRVRDEYADVIAYGRAAWTVAALERQGALNERLAQAILDTPIRLPRDLARQLRGRPDAIAEYEDLVRQSLAQQVAPVECLAIQRYAQAARVARAASLDDAHARAAIDRLQAYGDERVAQCLEEARAADPTLGAYTPGEFARARSAPVTAIPVGISPPPLAP